MAMGDCGKVNSEHPSLICGCQGGKALAEVLEIEILLECLYELIK